MNAEMDTTTMPQENTNVTKLSELPPLKYFFEPSLFLTHIRQAILMLGRTIMTYVIISFTGVLLFAVMYGFVRTVQKPFIESCKIYWAFGARNESIPSWIAFAETVFRDCVGVIMLGKIVTDMMIPNNPIEFSDFFIVTKEGEIKLRYWIMLPVGAVLHNARLRVLLIKDEEITRGDDELKPKNKCAQEVHDYREIRGVRSLTLGKRLSKHILEEFSKPKTDYKVRFMLSGALVAGRQYFSEKVYTKEDLFKADGYLSIRKDEFPEALERKADMPDKIYMNFNMAYCVMDKKIQIFYKPTKYVRLKNTKKEMRCFIQIGQEWNDWMLKNGQGRINKAINQMILCEYDKEKPIRGWIKNKYDALRGKNMQNKVKQNEK